MHLSLLHLKARFWTEYVGVVIKRLFQSQMENTRNEVPFLEKRKYKPSTYLRHAFTVSRNLCVKFWAHRQTVVHLRAPFPLTGLNYNLLLHMSRDKFITLPCQWYGLNPGISVYKASLGSIDGLNSQPPELINHQWTHMMEKSVVCSLECA